ncbi:hypothetical protein E2C01_049893 [Portunus trituberculatus]|uniref:Uncharacterized protein n=1 Tax=Portunus trituberculatus TaxID=210409 RepID=A0A5B7GF08_PORTR|nr:hypothetical protein [Portunus trituberculatus]
MHNNPPSLRRAGPRQGCHQGTSNSDFSFVMSSAEGGAPRRAFMTKLCGERPATRMAGVRWPLRKQFTRNTMPRNRLYKAGMKRPGL